MYSWKHLVAGFVVAAIIIISSVPLISFDSSRFDPSSDFCTAKHGKNEAECKADKAHHCVWCISRAVASMCFDEQSAKQLPPSVFKCEYPAQLEEADLETI